MNWIILFAGGLNLLLGLTVWLRNKRNRLNIYFGVFTIITALLCFFDFIFRYYPEADIVRVSYAFGVLVPTSAILWINELCEIRWRWIQKIILMSVSMSLVVITLLTDFVVVKVNYLTWLGYIGKTGVLFPYYSIYLSLLSIYIILSLYLTQRKTNSIRKAQLRYTLFGVVFYSLSALFFSLLLPSFFNIYEFTLLDAPSSLFFVGFSTYAIIRYRFMGVRFIASKIYFYALLSIFAFGYFHLIVFLDTRFMGGIYTQIALTTGVVFAVLFSIIFLPLLNKIQRSSDVLFYKGYNPREILKELSLKLSSVIKLDQVKAMIASEFKKILATEEVDVIVFSGDEAGCVPEKNGLSKTSSRYFNDVDLDGKSPICQYLSKNKIIIVKDEINKKDKPELLKEMSHHKISIIAPLMLRSKFVGVILLGGKIDQGAYTKEDIEFLEVISSQAAIAIENARLYKEVKDFNKSLKHKVDEQTKDIMQKADRLQKLIAMRSEFLDIASHQLRTPVSVIKGALSMIHDKGLTKVKKEELMNAAFQKSLKLEEVIDEILRASEMDTDRFELRLGPVQVSHLLQAVYEDKQFDVKNKKLKLELKMPKNGLPEINSEERYLKHCIKNLVNNAIQYTLKGKIVMSADVEGDEVVIRVKDNGIGIPPEDQPKLFRKFSRAKNAVDTYTDGSGLGLFIIKKIIDAHPGGQILIEKTEMNKGTTMALRIPIYKNLSSTSKCNTLI